MTPSEEKLRDFDLYDKGRSHVVVVWLATFAVCAAAAGLVWGVWFSG